MNDLVPIPLDLFDRIRRAGLDVDAILRRAKLPRSRFSVPKPQGTTAEFFALWHAVEAEGADPGLGLRIGVEVLPDEDNVVSLAAMHSATLGEGLQKLARFKRLVCPEKISIAVEDGEARLRFDWLLTEDAPPTVLTDIIFAGVTNPRAARDEDAYLATASRAHQASCERGDAPATFPLRAPLRRAARSPGL